MFFLRRHSSVYRSFFGQQTMFTFDDVRADAKRIWIHAGKPRLTLADYDLEAELVVRKTTRAPTAQITRDES
jgi:hypothetical protein